MVEISNLQAAGVSYCIPNGLGRDLKRRTALWHRGFCGENALYRTRSRGLDIYQTSISSVGDDSLEGESRPGKLELLPLVNKSLWQSVRLANEQDRYKYTSMDYTA
ncbi:MAG: hypothetical protein GY820_40930, partial [Gammaproteobacteria bacterium]|nr:hypothetical protein [Gammaproteobacteria bacterium]